MAAQVRLQYDNVPFNEHLLFLHLNFYLKYYNQECSVVAKINESVIEVYANHSII